MDSGANIIPLRRPGQAGAFIRAVEPVSREQQLTEIVSDLVAAVARLEVARCLGSPERIEAATIALENKALAAQAFVRGFEFREPR